ncbi:hypothetical protein NQ315_003195 [Exocentrus adspersus]|uniref:Reverse transcriptase domain-containing protein n=1 Tax=Exocentrus adspersus TaxID=1586481 RepID=A0AAV8VN49_9CUCU|nr:hypothetical protein NQ315_003195 [Exocentrus adspersus]
MRASRRSNIRDIETEENLYKNKRKELRRLIFVSKKEKWQELLENLNNDIWGEGYKIVMKHLNSYIPYTLTGEETRRAINELFPKGPNTNVRWEETADIRPFTIEVRQSLKSLKDKKAPGTDGIPVETIKKIALEKPNFLPGFLNKILQSQTFPTNWKTAKLILIPKERIHQTRKTKKFRPICLLNTISNLYESLIKTRLEAHMEEIGALSENQFGFRKKSIVEEWKERKGLTLAEQKTEAVVLKGPRKKEHLVFRVGATEIKTSKCAKYLGIILKENGVYTEHLKEAVRKAEKRTAILSRLMPNVGEPDSCKRKILHGVVKSVVLYGAQLWYPILDKITYKNMLARAERKSLLRLCSAYRTASTTALNVIAGEIPLHLLARERHRLHTRQEVNEQAKKEERNESMRKWQEEWERTEGVAEWTKRMIPNLQRWVEFKHRNTDYYLTQVFTGHGTFKTCLKRFGISVYNDVVYNDKCKYCGEVDTVQHTLFECHRWEIERRDLNSKVEEIISVDTFLDHMLSCKEKWRDIREFIKKVSKTKQQEE